LCAFVRFFVILLGLVSFKYVAVSFVETIKSSAPLFTALISYLILKEKNGVFVQLSLIPIMFGLVLCTVYELSFTMIGFAAAIGTNIAEWYVYGYSSHLVLLVFSLPTTTCKRRYRVPSVSVCLNIHINQSRSSADADKPARCIWRSVKVTKHSTIPYVRYSFLLCNSNFVFKTRRFL